MNGGLRPPSAALPLLARFALGRGYAAFGFLGFAAFSGLPATQYPVA